MNYKPYIKNKLLILLTILVAFIIGISIPSIKVYATSGNGTDDDAGRESHDGYAGGPSYAKSGWIMYIVDEKGTPVSDAVAISCTGEPQGATLMSTRLGGLNPRKAAGPVPWASATGYYGAAFDEIPTSKGADIKNWMLTDDGTGTENWYNVVGNIWGKEKAQAMAKNNHSLIMEPFYWMTIDGFTLCANAKNWGIFLSALYGAGNYGPSSFNLYTNQVFAHCAKFAYPQFGLQNYMGASKLTNGEMAVYAVGIMSITPKNSAIHTYWEVSPGNPEPRIPNKTGTCNIVKGYYKENLTTGAKQSLGVYYELDVTSNIIVSGEPNFELVEWRVTTATSTGVNPIAWNPPGTTSQQGKAGATLSLKDPEDCVYVLLRQVEEEETPAQDYNYLIPQSSITRRIWFSAPDNQLSMPRIQDHEFTWAIAF